MLSLRLVRLASLAAVVAGSIAARAQAGGSDDPVQIDYRTQGTCPDKPAFVAAVRARLALVSRRQRRDDRLYVVSLEQGTTHSLGRLEILDAGGRVDSHDVTGASCSEVATALALVTALSIAGEATIPSASFPAVQDTSPPATASTSQPLPKPPASLPLIRIPPPPPDLRTSSPVVTTRWRWSVGVQGVSIFAVAPVTGYGGAVFMNVGPTGAWIIRPEFRASAVYAATTSWLDTGARWKWWFARAEGCPLRIGGSDSQLYLNVCGALEAGPTGIERPVKETHPWFALGPEARLAWQTSGGWLLEAGAGIRVPLIHHTYSLRTGTFSSDRAVHTTPTFGPTLTLGLGYTWQ